MNHYDGSPLRRLRGSAQSIDPPDIDPALELRHGERPELLAFCPQCRFRCVGRDGCMGCGHAVGRCERCDAMTMIEGQCVRCGYDARPEACA